VGILRQAQNERGDMGWGKWLNHAIINVEMRNFLRVTAVILIIVGTTGLLLNDFVWEHSSTRTIIFAVVDVVGLVNLGFASFGMSSKADS
jgi:hypothetical protein